MILSKHKLSDGPTKRAIIAMLRKPETWQDMLVLCGLGTDTEDEATAAKRAADVFQAAFSVKWQADQRDELHEATEDNLAKVTEVLQKRATEAWVFTGKARAPKAPKKVTVQKKAKYTQAEVEALLAQAGSQAEFTE